MSQQRNKLITEEGEVTSLSGEKTIRVTIKTRRKHKIYNKILNYQKSYLVHDEKSEASIGDKVQIAFTKPISKNKNWRLSKIISSKSKQDILES